MRTVAPHMLICLGLLWLILPQFASADWPMAGHDPQRTSWAPEDEMPPATQPVWCRVIEPYIPSKAHLVTVAGNDGTPDLVYVPTAGGVYALNARDGSDAWVYATEMPVGHSPTVVDGVLYVGCFDKRVHAVDARTGKPIWRSARSGAGFDTSPVVVNSKVYAGCRDGYFYCFAASDGKLIWAYKTDGPIAYSAAYADGTVYFASNDSHAYALNAETGKLVWKSEKLPGDGFYGFWPVVAGDRVLFPGSNNYLPGGYQLEKINKAEAWPAGTKERDPIGPVDAEGWIDASGFVDYLKRHPPRRTLFVLDRATGQQAEIAPILWWGNPSGNRYPPAVGPEGIVYTSTPWLWSPDFPKGRIAGWRPGSARLFPLPSLQTGLDSNDEPDAYAVIGKDALYFNHDSDKEGGIYGLRGGTRFLWQHKQLREWFPGYCDSWVERKYGNGNFASPEKKGDNPGTHGNQNPPVPLNGRVYFHRSNAVMCFGSGRPAGGVTMLPLARRPARPAAAPGAGLDELPTVQAIEARLVREVEKMLAAGHLRPAYCICGEHYGLMGKLAGDCIEDYWHNPAETIYTLLRALPHLPAELQAKTREYIQHEFTDYPPTRITHVGWASGVARELFPLPPEPEKGLTTGLRAKPGNYPPTEFRGWRFNPFNIYACWKYAEALGGAKQILEEIRDRVKPLPEEDVLKAMPHVLNAYIAGYTGYLGLQALANETPSAEVRGWLDDALQKRVAHLAIHPRELNGTEAGGFLLLVPELGAYLNDRAAEAVARNVRLHEAMAEYWFVSRVDEVTRYETRTAFQEGATSHYYEYSSLFNAKALALRERRMELEKYLDVPAVERGDLFYIQNLVGTIEAQ